MYSGAPYSRDKRVLACMRCSSPVESPATGGSARCARCGSPNDLRPRDESADRAAAQSAPSMSEAMRFERLRAQDGKPLPFPPQLKHLLAAGIDDQSIQQAWNEWQQARHELLQSPSFAAAERLYFLAMQIYGYLSPRQRHLEARALCESSLELLHEPRFRQEMMARLARGAVNAGDVAAAQGWFELMAPHTDDLHMDTAYRLTGAWLATAKSDFREVLNLLGARIDDIPIADTSDTLCAIIRANALERSGQTQAAVEQLVQLAARTPGGAQTLQQIFDANQHLQFCPHGFPLAREQLGQMQTQAVRTRGGFKFGCVFVPVFVGGFALAAAMGLAEEYLDSTLAPIVMTVMVVGFIALTFVLVFGTIFKMNAMRKRLRAQGVAGSAQVLGANETGTRVNNQPLVEMQLLVNVPGRSPYTAIHKEIVSNINLGRLAPGVSLPVRVDPNDPTMMAVDW